MISLSQVRMSYRGGHEALAELSFSIETGELVFITGRSGAGKSTLLKLIPAIERPTSGTVLVNGQNIGSMRRPAIPYLRRNLGLIFQDQKLLYDRSVFDNVMLPLAFTGHAHKEAARARRWTRWACWRGKKPTRSRSQAGNSSACASPAPWSTGPASCSPTNPPPASTPPPPPRSWRCSAPST